MKKIRHLILLLLCTALSAAALAQNTLRIEIIPTGVDSFAVIKNGSLPFTLRMYNDSTTDYVDTIGFNYSIDSAGVGAPVTYTDTNGVSGLSYNIVSDTIFGQDSIDVTITINAGEPRFKTGPSVVVIWPIRSSNEIAGNNLTFIVNVLTPNGVEDPADIKLRVFMWEDKLFINRQPGIQLNQLKIYDIAGREIFSKQNPADVTTLPLNAHGVYIAEIMYGNNQRSTFRFYY